MNRLKTNRIQRTTYLVVPSPGPMLIRLRSHVRNVKTIEHIICKYKLDLLMSRAQFFTSVVVRIVHINGEKDDFNKKR